MHGRPWLALGESDDRGRILAALTETPLICMWLEPRELAVDLDNPTGLFHSLLWLAEKLGMSAENGVWWRYAFGWRLETPLASWTFGVGIGSERYTRVEIPADSLPAEALKLAVLAVAGVQG
jgi:hypothetical protein